MTPDFSDRLRGREADAYRARRIAQWDGVAAARVERRGPTRAYHRRLEHVYRFLVAPGLRVLELGCSDGDLLASIEPSVGVGVDFSPRMLARARSRHPHLQFVEADAHDLSAVSGAFDVIILSDLLHDIWDVQTLLGGLHPLCHRGTRVVMNFYSRLWEAPLTAARRMGLAEPLLKQNWLTMSDVRNLAHLTDFRVIRAWQEVLCPLPAPGLAPLGNKVLVRLPGLRHLALANFMIARPLAAPDPGLAAPRVSVIVAARNEAGNVPALFARTPEMGGGTELIFVEGHSSDDTYSVIDAAIAANPHRRARLLRQTGRGKGDAVRAGFAAATGEILMILDADLTVPPEDLPRFYDAMVTNKGEFINGVRLMYPMEERAMRFANLLGNKFFSLAFTWLLGQSIKDTLCGTKVLRRGAYQALAANRAYFGDFDPFGDFDLLFGAAKLSLEIVDLPIRYRERTYGTTNIQRWSHGWLLLKMCVFAAGRIKFV
ncbi:MAG: glycosyltransferase [Luteitalea sp.]|nr:glycosyltransferase [Luteitalea sp.]